MNSSERKAVARSAPWRTLCLFLATSTPAIVGLEDGYAGLSTAATVGGSSVVIVIAVAFALGLQRWRNPPLLTILSGARRQDVRVRATVWETRVPRELTNRSRRWAVLPFVLFSGIAALNGYLMLDGGTVPSAVAHGVSLVASVVLLVFSARSSGWTCWPQQARALDRDGR